MPLARADRGTIAMWTILRVTCGATLAVWVVTGTVSAQHWHDEREHWMKYDKHLDNERDRDADVHLQGCFLQPADVHIISAYYAPRYRELPAAQRKRFFRSSHLPDGWEKRIEALPASVDKQLIAIPREYRRGIIDGSIVLYVPKTGAILDSVVLFSPR
jgi:hypothetical protein